MLPYKFRKEQKLFVVEVKILLNNTKTSMLLCYPHEQKNSRNKVFGFLKKVKRNMRSVLVLNHNI